MDKVIIIADGGEGAMSAARLAMLKTEYGDDLIIVGSIKEAEEKGYIYHKHTYPEPTEPMYLKNFRQPELLKTPFLEKEKSPIDAIAKRNKFGRHKY